MVSMVCMVCMVITVCYVWKDNQNLLWHFKDWINLRLDGTKSKITSFFSYYIREIGRAQASIISDSRHPCHCLCIFRACSRRTTRRCHQPSRSDWQATPSDKSHKIPLDKKWSELLRKHRPEIRWCWCARALHTNHMMSVVYLMIEWTIEIRRDADVVKHHCHYQFRQSCHLASLHTIPFHPILDELYVDCMSTALTSLPLVNVIGHRLANLIIPGTLQVHSLSPGRPMPGSRGCQGACYICMYIHTYILHPDIYPTYDFFFLSDRHST